MWLIVVVDTSEWLPWISTPRFFGVWRGTVLEGVPKGVLDRALEGEALERVAARAPFTNSLGRFAMAVPLLCALPDLALRLVLG